MSVYSGVISLAEIVVLGKQTHVVLGKQTHEGIDRRSSIIVVLVSTGMAFEVS